MAFTIHTSNGEASTFCIGNGRAFALFTTMATNFHGDGIIRGNDRNFE